MPQLGPSRVWGEISSRWVENAPLTLRCTAAGWSNKGFGELYLLARAIRRGRATPLSTAAAHLLQQAHQ
ncbi:MAG: hypothetical protein ACREVY_08520, partial [Gammaproteobacteria bacterium]